MTINDITDFLYFILLEKNAETRKMPVFGFENYIFNRDEPIRNGYIDKILNILAHDLGYYIADSELSKNAASFLW